MTIKGLNVQVKVTIDSFEETINRNEKCTLDAYDRNTKVNLNGFDFDINYGIDEVQVETQEISQLINAVVSTVKTELNKSLEKATKTEETVKVPEHDYSVPVDPDLQATSDKEAESVEAVDLEANAKLVEEAAKEIEKKDNRNRIYGGML